MIRPFAVVFALLIGYALAFGPLNDYSRISCGARSLTMKKKGGRVPIDQRGEFLKRQRMIEQRDQMESSNKRTDVPIFQVFVRPKAGGLWIPVGDLAGDNRAKQLVEAWMSGFMSDMYKKEVDRGIANSIFSQEEQFVSNLIANYKPFKKFTKDDLVFGYKVKYEGLEEKLGEQKILLIEESMKKGWVDNLKDGFSNLFSSKS